MSERSEGDFFEMSGDFRQATIYIKSEVAGGRGVRIPFQRPPRAEHFVGREQELEEIVAALQPGRVVTLCGPGGIGKSALAAEAVWRLAPGNAPPERFPDGIVFHSFYNQPQASQALESIALAFDEEPRPTPRDAAQRALAGRRALLILDGTEDADDLQAVLNVRGGCGVLVTSRTRKDALAERQDLPPLSHDDAVDLLQMWGGERATEAEPAGQICELVGRLPLAVRLVGRYLDETGEPAADYLAWLEDTPLQALDHGRRQEESVPVLLEKSLAQASDEARKVLSVVGLLALAPFSREPLAAALERSPNQLRKPLGELVSYGLLLRSGKQYEVSHALVQTFARRRLVAPEGSLARVADYLIRLAREHQNQGLEQDEAMDAARPHIMALSARLAEQGMRESLIELAHIVTRSRGDGYLQVRGFWNDEEAYLKRALQACEFLMGEATGDGKATWARHKADLAFALGDLYFYRDQYGPAAEAFDESLALTRHVDDGREEAAATHLKLGEIYLNRSRFDRAREHFGKSLQIREGLGEEQSVLAPIHLWIGRTYGRQRSYEEARRHYQKSFDYYQEAGKKTEGAFVLTQLGALAFDQAWDYLRRSEALLEQAEPSLRSAEVRRELANHYRWNKRFEKAEALQLLSLQDFERLEDRHNIAWSLQSLGDTYFEMGDLQKAEEKYRQALKYFEELGIQHGQGYAYDHLGMLRLNQERAEEARALFEKGLRIFRSSGLQDGIAYLLSNLADAEKALGQVEEAERHYNEALRIWEELDDPERISFTKKRLNALSG
ncbi:MAG: tetratricopeptide repeat protein [Candidatus Promineifilaceae bacterium]|nr:tetratricopeptide repeat protein [Candidatus Promineifilaceae bacterium]